MKRIFLSFSTIIVSGYLLNYIWEKSHIALFKDYEVFVSRLPLPTAMYTSLVDVCMILLIYFLIAATRKKLFWIENFDKSAVAKSIIFGSAIAIAIELQGLAQNKWTYNEFMPIIPLIKVGLSPVMQMIVLPITTFYIIHLILKKISYASR